MPSIPLKIFNATGAVQEVFLRLSVAGEPIVLGTGRFASVVLATRDPQGSGNPLAVKFLKLDESENASRIARDRFLEELAVNRLLNDEHATSFIDFIGFSCTAAALSVLAADTVLSTVPPHSRGVPQQLLVDIARSNYAASRAPEKFASFVDKHQDVLLVMEAASLSLDELLHHRGRISELAIFRKRQAADAGGADEQPFETVHGRSLQDVRSRRGILIDRGRQRLGVTDESTGFDVLKALSDPKFGDASEITILSLWKRIVHAVEQVHVLRFRETPGDPADRPGDFAHRDLKPNNILLADIWGDRPTVELSDLGQVGGIEKISNVRDTKTGNPRDPGVLPGGSAGFRSPEQVVNGAEVVFWTAKGGGSVPGTEIFSRPLGDVRIENGDVLETSDLPFPDGQRKVLVKFVKELPAEGEQNCTLARAWDPHDSRSSYRGNIGKPIGQHSDVFALGCLLYYLVSGGLNPEKFYAKVLEVDSSWRRHKEADTCLEIALRYCDEDSYRLEGQFTAIASHLQESGSLTPDEAHRLRQSRLRFDRLLLGDEAKQRRADPVIARYLRHASNRPISLPVLYLVVACMQRGLKDSFVRVHPGCPPEEVRTATSRIEALTSHFISKALTRKESPLEDLNDDVTTAFLHVRCL